MDSIKRNLFKDSQNSLKCLKNNTRNNQGKEEVFISCDESEVMDKKEKEFRTIIIFKKSIALLAVLVLIFSVSYGLYFSWKTYTISKKINSEYFSAEKKTLSQYARAIISPIIPSSHNQLKGEENGRINILLLGTAGEHKPGGNLTDTVIIMSVDTKNKKVAMFSLPRDLYVKIPDTQSHAKINSLYPIGIKMNEGVNIIKKSVEEITGIELNYYLVINFEGFKKIIDQIGGINIISQRDIYDTRYPGQNYSYETFSLSKGFHVLDGETALKYVRQRHGDPEGDFGRAKRQQQVIQAVKNKLFSVKTLLNVITLNNILNTLEESIKTDITFEDIDGFIKLSQEVDMQNINNIVADAWKKDSLLKVSHVTLGNASAFILIPRIGNYSEIHDLEKNIFNLDELKKRQDAIVEEKAKIGIINNSGESQLNTKIKNLLTEKLNIKNVYYIQKSQDIVVSQTKITDNSNGIKIFTLDELIKKLPATLSNEPIDTTTPAYDIIITLGSDLANIYKYEEDTMQDLENAEDKQEIFYINNTK